MKSIRSQNVTCYQNIKQQHIYIYISKMQSRPRWKASSKVSARYSAHLVSLSLSLSPYRCVLVGAHMDPTLSNPPLFKNAKEQAKTYQGSQPGQEILQVFSWLYFSAKKLCHSTWQLLFGKKKGETKQWTWSLVGSWEVAMMPKNSSEVPVGFKQMLS